LPIDTRLLILHPSDHVGIATAPLAKGETALAGEARIRCLDPIPFGHKVAVRPVGEGEAILKYGFPIGRARRAIGAGEHVHVHNCRSTRGRPEGTASVVAGPQGITGRGFSTPQANAAPLPALSGYRRADGRIGFRNHLLVLPTVQCANGVVERIGRSVSDAVALPHAYGCSQIGADLEQTTRVLEAFAGHPNVGAVLLVSLGCETLDARAMADRLRAAGRAVELLVIQEVGGTEKAYEAAPRIIEGLRETLRSIARVEVLASDLIVGVECGGSDAWSGVTANPAVGSACDRIVASGGTVILSEVTEFIGAESVLAARADREEVSREILRIVQDREEAVRAGRRSAAGRASEFPEDLAPGNVEGGLTTIEEKSLGAIAKGGTSPVREVVAYGRRPIRKGLVVMDTAGNDPESVTGMVAGGAQIVLFTTGRGSPTGCPVAPVIKVATNTSMFSALRGDMDANAGTILDGEPTDGVGARIAETLARVAGGALTAAERGGHGVFAIERLGPKV